MCDSVKKRNAKLYCKINFNMQKSTVVIYFIFNTFSESSLQNFSSSGHIPDTISITGARKK